MITVTVNKMFLLELFLLHQLSNFFLLCGKIFADIWSVQGLYPPFAPGERFDLLQPFSAGEGIIVGWTGSQAADPDSGIAAQQRWFAAPTTTSGALDIWASAMSAAPPLPAARSRKSTMATASSSSSLSPESESAGRNLKQPRFTASGRIRVARH